MPMFRCVGGSVLTANGQVVDLDALDAMSLKWRGEALNHGPTVASIYTALADDAEAAVRAAEDWNRAAAGAPL